MNKNLKKIFLLVALTVTTVVCLAFSASAAQNGYYTYEVKNGEATITDVDESISGKVTIPSKLGGYSVTSIGDGAFKECNNLKSVTIPDSVTSIGTAAFEYCYSLTSVTIPDSVTRIGDEAFYGCYSLKSVTIPDSVTSIGEWAFANCDSLTSVTIPDSVTSIGDGAFYNCYSLTSVTIPDSVTRIGDGVFAECYSLTSVTIPDSVTSIGSDAFSDCTRLKSAILPDGITTINSGTFYNCKNLTDVTIPNTVRSIAEDSFYNCVSLENVIFLGTEKEWNNIYKGNMGSEPETEYLICANIQYKCLHKKVTNKAITPATTSKNGYTAGAKCNSCGAWVKGHKIIPKISSVTLSATNYVYNGKNKTPTVTVKDSNGKKLTKNVDYKISVASNRSGIGRYTVKVTFIGNYEGSKNLYFYIKPSKTSSVKPVSQTTNSIKLSWSKVAGASGYTVYRYSPAKKAYVKAGTTSGTSLTVKSLLAGTKYTFRVVAYGKVASTGKVYESNGYALLKTATKTKTPELTKVTASTTTNGKVSVYHSNVSGETGYTVYYSTKKDSGFKKYANFKADTTRADITKLTGGKTYYFKVRTYIKTDSGYVYSDWSNIKSIKAPTVLPAASLNSRPLQITDISLSLEGSNSVKMTWKKRNSNVTYLVSSCNRSTGGGFKVVTKTKNPACTIKDLKTNNLYELSIRAYIEKDGVTCCSETSYVDIIIKNGKLLRDEKALVGYENYRPVFDDDVEYCDFCGKDNCGPSFNDYYCVICKKTVYARTCHPKKHLAASV